MALYLVLQPLSPHTGPIIFPAVATAADPEPAPVLVSEELFSGDSPEEKLANAERLIGLGVIAAYTPPPPPETDKPARARKVAPETNEE